MRHLVPLGAQPRFSCLGLSLALINLASLPTFGRKALALAVKSGDLSKQ